MITLANQIQIQFSVGSFSDFITIENFKSMELLENAGGVRPILNVSFQLDDLSILPYLNKGNIITLSFGITALSSDVYNFEIENDFKIKQYTTGSLITLLCSAYNPKFCSYIKARTFQQQKSYEVLKQLASDNNLNFVTNVTKTLDTQDWEQLGQTDWTFLHEVWQSSYLDTSTFFSYAFDNNNLYFYNMKELIAAGPKWILTTSGMGVDSNSSTVTIDSYLASNDAAGSCAQLAGKNLNIVNYDLDSGTFSSPTYSLQSFTTMNTNKLNLNTQNCQTYEYTISSDSNHNNDITAINQNKRNNILYSSYNCHVPVLNQYRNFKLLDCVQLKPSTPDEEAQGFYIITGIAHQYKNQIFQTVLTLNRESENGLRGSDLVASGG